MFAFDLMLSPWHKESVERALERHHRSRRRGALRPGLDAEQPRHPAHRHPPRSPRGRGPRQLDGQQPQPDRHRCRPGTRRPSLACADRAGVRGARQPVPLPGRGTRAARGVRHPRRPARRPRVPPDARRGNRPRRVPNPAAVDGRPGDVVRFLDPDGSRARSTTRGCPSRATWGLLRGERPAARRHDARPVSAAQRGATPPRRSPAGSAPEIGRPRTWARRPAARIPAGGDERHAAPTSI